MNGLTFRRAARIIVLLATVGLSREAWFHLAAEPVWQLPARIREPRPEARYLAVRAVLPRAGRVGYLTDVPVTSSPETRRTGDVGTWLYQQAQYALAPLVLVPGEARTEAVLANVVDPARIDILARTHRLRVAQRFEDGHVAVLLK